MQQNFYPAWAIVSREVILETINCELEQTIKSDDPRLTDELCQEIVNNWNTQGIWDEDIIYPLWEDEDTISEYWVNRFKEIFNITDSI